MSNRVFVNLSGEAEAIWKEIETDIKQPTYRKDPWAAREAWRYAPELSKAAGRKLMFGGSGYGVIAFVVYCFGEYAYHRMIGKEVVEIKKNENG